MTSFLSNERAAFVERSLSGAVFTAVALFRASSELILTNPLDLRGTIMWLCVVIWINVMFSMSNSGALVISQSKSSIKKGGGSFPPSFRMNLRIVNLWSLLFKWPRTYLLIMKRFTGFRKVCFWKRKTKHVIFWSGNRNSGVCSGSRI